MSPRNQRSRACATAAIAAAASIGAAPAVAAEQVGRSAWLTEWSRFVARTVTAHDVIFAIGAIVATLLLRHVALRIMRARAAGPRRPFVTSSPILALETGPMPAMRVPVPESAAPRAARPATIRASRRSSTVSDVEGLMGQLIVKGYRRHAAALGDGVAPTAKTNDERLAGLYFLVSRAFMTAATARGEVLPVGVINAIVFTFMQLDEQSNGTLIHTHLAYEIARYQREGLREDYKRELWLF